MHLLFAEDLLQFRHEVEVTRLDKDKDWVQKMLNKQGNCTNALGEQQEVEQQEVEQQEVEQLEEEIQVEFH